jgi:hypothetical protein
LVRQRRLTGVEDMVISLSAKGLTHGEIAAHLAEVYGADVSKQTITTITDRVMEGMAEWQSRPLDPVYAVIFDLRFTVAEAGELLAAAGVQLPEVALLVERTEGLGGGAAAAASRPPHSQAAPVTRGSCPHLLQGE